MPTSTVEDYLKHLYILQQRARTGRRVPLGKLAEAIGVTPGTATSMVKTLATSGLVRYTPRGGARLTAAGESLALMVLRRHRLVELLLVKVLGLDWSEVHVEAERLEHAVSDKVLEKIDAMLGHPSVDPHGDPIPSLDGELSGRTLTNLTDCQLNRVVRIARVADQNPLFLQFAEHHGLTPGIDLVVESRDPAADAVTIRIASSEPTAAITLGSIAAAKFLVEVTRTSNSREEGVATANLVGG